jgi:hypothetical protein
MKGVNRRLDKRVLGCWQAFLTAPLTPSGKRSDGVRSEKSAGCLNVGSLERFHFEGLGLRFCFSFQTPIRASEFRSESGGCRMDAVQSIGDERL